MPGDGIYELLEQLQKVDQAHRANDSDSDGDSESVMEDIPDGINIEDGQEYEAFTKELVEFKNGNGNNIRGIILYVYQPSCPHCKNYMPVWESETDKIKHENKDSVKIFKIKAGDIDAGDDLIPHKQTVPQLVMYYYKSPTGVVNKDLSDERTRHELSSLVGEILGLGADISPPKKETVKQKKKPLGNVGKKGKNKKSTELVGRGIVESVLTAGILGGAVISSTKSPQVASILKETIKGVESITSIAKSSIESISGKKPSKNVIKQGITSATKAINAQKYADATTDAIKGISQTTADVIQGKIKKLTRKDLMRVYRSSRSSRSSRSNKTRKNKKSSK